MSYTPKPLKGKLPGFANTSHASNLVASVLQFVKGYLLSYYFPSVNSSLTWNGSIREKNKSLKLVLGKGPFIIKLEDHIDCTS
ncbi:hypothetical protein DM860_016570 [Cuscuta australis]|uniref:Uncharacterized protein n=1 Tax=Cuscuta australis TaxID=267555 RepID=A0A328DN85_9ASTE|nr:hypothetical protein DM860_016570 [Cuscuta australis]